MRAPKPRNSFRDWRPSRRDFLRVTGAVALSASLTRLAPAWAQSPHASHAAHGVQPAEATPATRPASTGKTRTVDLTIERIEVPIGHRVGRVVAVNRSLPAPLLRFREGDEVELRVMNRLDESASIHWHGLLVPAEMDGVPGVSFKGIDPGETFVYRFPLRQYGTYWYHSHSGMHEQLGQYGPIIVDPAHGEHAARGVGAGFTEVEFGLRLRYEFTRQFAPYIGVTWVRALGESAGLRRRADERVSRSAVVLGVRTWF